MAGLLTARELAGIRADATASLPDTCDVLTWLRQRDRRGGDDQRVARTTRATAVPVLLSPVERLVQGAEGGGLYGPTASRGLSLDSSAMTWLALLPHGTALAVGDELHLTSGAASGQRFEVIGIEDAEGYATALGAKVIRAGVTNAETE